MLRRITKFFSYWKEVIIISVGCFIFFLIADIYFPDNDNPFWSNSLKSGTEIMAEKWPVPEPNDPNFLADYREYMGYEWEEYIKIGN